MRESRHATIKKETENEKGMKDQKNQIMLSNNTHDTIDCNSHYWFSCGGTHRHAGHHGFIEDETFGKDMSRNRLRSGYGGVLFGRLFDRRQSVRLHDANHQTCVYHLQHPCVKLVTICVEGNVSSGFCSAIVTECFIVTRRFHDARRGLDDHQHAEMQRSLFTIVLDRQLSQTVSSPGLVTTWFLLNNYGLKRTV